MTQRLSQSSLRELEQSESERALQECCSTLDKQVSEREKIHREDHLLNTSLATDLAWSWALLQEMLDQQTQTELKMTKLKDSLVMANRRNLQLVMERDQALFRLADRESQLGILRLGLTQVSSQVATLFSQYSVVSGEAWHLTFELWVQEASCSDGL